ncbi:Na+/H+ antiporter NhaC family protein [Clostridium sp. AM58-1XD]|uniref:GntP family permease n=1 Tax=Clostridium sp. AM58-1XD TaxID=2292307 RepID=UPI000E4AD9D9|nr:Na+/H+ antiporter NhaC family protein [Clostridium sp. AM58-1XD]RGY97387.1 GntP family permease [Clostridium sp. AM58-1XD]
MSMLWIPVFIFLFAVLAYKRWSPVLLGPTVSVILCVVTGLPVLDTMMGPYMTATTDFIKSNFFVFFLGAIFGAVMEETNAAKAIAVWMSGITKGKFVLPLIMTIAGILCYGGVLGFVVYFAVYPITLHLCREANISRALIPATIGAGCWTWANALPGSPAIPNVIASKTLGTPATADLGAGILFCGIMMYALCFLYLEWQARKYKALNRGFVMDNVVKEEMESKTESKMPKIWLALLPMIIILVLYNVIGISIEFALLAGVLFAFVSMYRCGGDAKTWLKTFNKGAGNTTGVILNVSLVVGFAGVMKQTEMFNLLVESIGKLNIPPLVFVAVTTATCAAASASSSGGMGVAMTTFGSTYLSMGVNPALIHRVAVVAASTLDTLPHTGGQITLLQICHQTHKDSFSHIFITQAIIPIICLVCLIAWHGLGF